MELPGRVVVVGGSAGIGAGVAALLGGNAVVWSRRHGVDATQPASVAAAAARLLAGGAPWGLVHCVGDFLEQPLLATSAVQLDALWQNNVVSALHVLQAVVPAMAAAGRGRVILFAAAGVEQRRAMTRAPAYFAVKAALLQMARSLAAEVAPRGVTVNVISPGLIEHPHSHQQSQRRMLPRVPAGRLGSVDDVVALIGWLLQPASAYTTGENFTVDGGLQL